MRISERHVGPLALALACMSPVTTAAGVPAGGAPSGAVPQVAPAADGVAPPHGGPVIGTVRTGFGSSSGARTASREWRSPVTPLRVSAPFDPPALPWQAGHRGVDLAAEPGTPVRAAGAGLVTFAAELAGRGVLVVDHGTVRTTYEPVAASVVVGQWVRAGDPVGTVAPGSGHCGTGSCLHLGLRRGSEYLDPMLLLCRTSARLRPW